VAVAYEGDPHGAATTALVARAGEIFERAQFGGC
jgi:hypothetical protein